YVYVPQGTFEKLSSPTFEDLVSLCKPGLAEIVSEDVQPQMALPFVEPTAARDEFLPEEFEKLPSRYQNNIRQEVMLYRFLENKENVSFSAVFTPLLGAMEDASNALLLARLLPLMPQGRIEEKEFFSPQLTGLEPKKIKYYQDEVRKLERTLIFRSPISP